MSKSVDQKIVQLKFDNDDFESNVKTSLDTLDKLNEKTEKIGDAANNIDFRGFDNAISTVKVKFSALQIVGHTIVSRITNDIMDSIKKIPKLFDPIINGVEKTFNIIKTKGWNRAADLENAEFQLEGLGIAYDKVSEQIKNAVDGTAYGLDEAAKAASQLAASGVKIGDDFKDAKGGIEGTVDAMERALGAISGVAAMTNSSYSEIADVFTDAAGRGKVTADTFNRIAQRGLNAAAALAKAMGVTETSVREMASKGKISFQMFADAMYDAYYDQAKKSNETFDGSLANMQAALGRIGALFATPLRNAMIEPFNQLRMLINRVKAELVPFADDFENLINAASKLFSEVIGNIDSDDLSFVHDIFESIENVIKSLLLYLIPVKDAFAELFPGSFFNKVKNLTDGIKKFTEGLIPTAERMNNVRKVVYSVGFIFKNLGTILKTIIGAFTKAQGNAKGLVEIIMDMGVKTTSAAASLAEFIDKNDLLAKALSTIGKVVGTVFTALKNLGMLVGGAIGIAFTKLVELVKNVKEAFSNDVGDPNSNKLVLVINKIKEVISKLLEKLPEARESIRKFFDDFKSADTISDKFELILDKIRALKEKIVDVLGQIKDAIKEAFSASSLADSKGGLGASLLGTKVGNFDMSKISDVIANIKDFVKNLDYGKIAALGFIGVLMLLMGRVSGFVKALTGATKEVTTISGTIKNLIQSLSGALNGSITGIGGSIKNLIDTIAESKKQKTSINDVADALLKFSGAIAVLAAVLIALSFANKYVDLKGTIVILGELAVGIVIFAAALGAVNKFLDLGFIVKLSVALVLMAASILILAKAFNEIEASGNIGTAFEKLGTIGILMIELAAAAAVVSKMAPSITKGSIFLLFFALSVKVLAKVLSELPDMTTPLETLGLLALGITLIAKYLSKGLSELGKAMLSFGGTILAIAVSALLLVAAIKLINTVKQEEINYALRNFGLLFVLIGAYAAVVSIVVGRFGKDLPKFGALLITSAAAVAILALVVERIGNIPLGQLVKGTAVVLAILAMFGSLMLVSQFTEKAHPVKFAAALLVITGCVAMLGGLAALFGLIPLPQLAKGLGVIYALTMLIGALMVVSQYTEKANVKAIVMMLVSVEILFATIIVLSLMKDWESVYKAVGVMALVMFTFGKMLKDIGSGKYDNKSILAMLAGVFAIAAVAAALYVLKDNDWKQLLSAGSAISATLYLYAHLLETISSRSGLKPNKIGTFLAATLALVPVAGALWLVAKNDWSSILASGAAISAVLYMYSHLLETISSRSGFKTDKIATFLAATLAFIPIGIALGYVAQNDWNSVLAAGASISAVVMAFSAALELMSKVNIDVGTVGMFLLATLSLVPISIALSSVAAQPWENILAAGASISAVMLSISAALGVISLAKVDLAAVGAFLLASLSVIPIGYALAEMAAMPWENILAASAAMSLAVIAISAAITLMGVVGGGLTALAGAGSLVIAAAGMFVLAEALIKFNEVNSEALIAAGLALLGITAAIAILGLIGPVALIGAAAILAVCFALDLLAVAVIAAAVGMEMFVPSLIIIQSLDGATIAKNLVLMAAGLAAFSAACLLLSLNALGLTVAALTLPMIASGLMMLSMVGDVMNAAKGLAEIAVASGLLAAVGPGMVIAAGGLTVLAVSFNLLAPAVLKLAAAFSASVTIIETSLKKLSSVGNSEGFKIGEFTVSGMIKGILSKIPDVIKSAAEMASKFINTIKTKLDIHSPSKVMQWLGKMCGVGFDEGSTDKQIWNGIGKNIGNALDTHVVQPAKDAAGKVKEAVKSSLSDLEILDKYSDVRQKIMTGGNFKGNFRNEREAIEALGLTTDKTNDSLLDMDSIMDDLSGSMDGAAGSARETKSAFEELSDNIAQQIDLFAEFDGKTELTADKLLSNMKSQIDGVTNWANMMAQLGNRGINEGLLEYLGNLGPKGYEYVNAFVNMTAEQLDQAGQYFEQSLVLPDAAAATVTNSYAQAGYWSAEGFKEGLVGNTAKAVEAAKNMGLDSLTGIKEVLGIHSPSVEMEKVGMYMMIGLMQGILQNKDKVKTAMDTMYLYSVKMPTMDELGIPAGGGRSEVFYEYGGYICQGLAEGIEDNWGLVEAAMVSLADLCKKTFTFNTKIESPSKVFRGYGKFIDLGLGNGIKDNAGYVANSVDYMTEHALSNMQYAIDRISDVIDSDMDCNPTITPVLDLSNVTAGADEINTMFGSGRSMRLSGNISAGMNARLDSGVSVDATNADVVNAINKLRNDMGAMTAQIGNYKMVLNSGALVGQLIGDIDSTLGARAAKAARGL